MRNTASFFFVCIAFMACNLRPPAHDKRPVYSFDAPDSVVYLPESLHEISGLVALSDTIAAAVQDEEGILFFYDLRKSRISHTIDFAGAGDYEGVTAARDVLFVLRSDGVLFRIKQYTSASPLIDSADTHMPTANNEGLCFDGKNNRLLIAAKSKPGKGKEWKDKRVIYGFDLVSEKRTTDPVVEINVTGIKEEAGKRGIDLPDKLKKNGSIIPDVLKMKTSEVAIHPESGDLYVLSAADHFLFVFGPDGTIREIHPLNPALFNKAEGITFLKNGQMVISNEGQTGKPKLIYLSGKTSD